MKKAKKNPSYINNKEFYECMVVYKNKVLEAKLEGKNKPPIPNFAGKCIMQIAQNLSTKYNFVNYPFKEDMIGDSIENCIKYFDNFDPEKSKNPFTYFTTITWWAFVRRIQTEKKYLYTKHKLYEKSIVSHALAESQDDVNLGTHDMDSDKMHEFIENFEKKMNIKKKSSKLKGVEQFTAKE